MKMKKIEMFWNKMSLEKPAIGEIWMAQVLIPTIGVINYGSWENFISARKTLTELRLGLHFHSSGSEIGIKEMSNHQRCRSRCVNLWRKAEMESARTFWFARYGTPLWEISFPPPPLSLARARVASHDFPSVWSILVISIQSKCILQEHVTCSTMMLENILWKCWKVS